MKVERNKNKLPKLWLSVMLVALVALMVGCDDPTKPNEPKAESIVTTSGNINLPPPYATKSVTKRSKVIGWPVGKTPVVSAGLTITRYADGLVSPRNIYVADNGDVFIAEANTEISAAKRLAAKVTGDDKAQRLDASPNRITILRDVNLDGVPEVKSVFLSNLNQPFGMLIIGNYFYVANTDGLWRYPYKQGDTSITQTGQKIQDLPASGYNNHWTRNLIANKDNSKIYISVGSGSNVAEHGMENEVRRANILEINPDGSGERIYASGLRNPVGMDWHPETNVLWTAVNERDELGDDLVPDYITGLKDGGFYGWPFSYFGQHLDPRIKEQKPELVSKAIVPDQPLGAHTASLGLTFYDGSSFPVKYRNGALVSQHGSWNRSELAGYKVIFVPFANGKPSGSPEDFLTGFIAGGEDNEVYGRPVGVAVARDGSLLVADDAANVIWRVGKQ